MLGLYDFFSESAMNPNTFCLQGKKKDINETTFFACNIGKFLLNQASHLRKNIYSSQNFASLVSPK